MRLTLVLTLFCLCLSAAAVAKEYLIGIEQLDYYPHYDFKSAQPRGYIYDLIQLYSQWSGDSFRFVPLPVKRLYADAMELTDFVYPDNSAWQAHLAVAGQPEKIFSDPVIYTLGSTMVRPENAAMQLEQFKVLAHIHGFSPTLWAPLLSQYKIRILEVPDAEFALKMTLRGRVDGANVEYNVAAYHLAQMKQSGALVAGQSLPFSNLAFHLSTQKHPEQIRRFNRFLQEQAAAVKALKQRYALIEFKHQLPAIAPAAPQAAEIRQ
ncbi:transporter substrate-binding domain-containing protein [Rheinheimera sp.]|uniref:substrate-binding periplasmic protein n=1 Tax=Rheinheimera sp. TaxID=1869214 RepID=UPI00307DE082